MPVFGFGSTYAIFHWYLFKPLFGVWGKGSHGDGRTTNGSGPIQLVAFLGTEVCPGERHISRKAPRLDALMLLFVKKRTVR